MWPCSVRCRPRQDGTMHMETKPGHRRLGQPNSLGSRPQEPSQAGRYPSLLLPPATRVRDTSGIAALTESNPTLSLDHADTDWAASGPDNAGRQNFNWRLSALQSSEASALDSPVASCKTLSIPPPCLRMSHAQYFTYSTLNNREKKYFHFKQPGPKQPYPAAPRHSSMYVSI